MAFFGLQTVLMPKSVEIGLEKHGLNWLFVLTAFHMLFYVSLEKLNEGHARL